MRDPNDLGPRSVLTRRAFGLGAAALLTAGAFIRPARAQETTTVETWIGPVTIPVEPQRVIAVDSRLALEPVVAGAAMPIVRPCARRRQSARGMGRRGAERMTQRCPRHSAGWWSRGPRCTESGL